MRFILVGLFCFWQIGLSAQQKTLSFNQAITSLEAESKIKFTYDPAIAEVIDFVYPVAIDLNNFIALTASNTALNVKQITENYFSIVLENQTYQLILSDSLSSQPIIDPILAIDGIVIPITQVADHWEVTILPKSDQQISIHAVGFEDKRLSFQKFVNQTTLNIKLHPRFLELADITIYDYLTKGIDLDPASQSIKVNTEDLPLLPGETDGDIFASIAALPGISNPDNRAGNLFIRGSSTDQSLILYNDIPIYHRGHYFGTLSPYNQKTVSEVEVYRNGFHPSMGDRVGGAIKINSEYTQGQSSKVGVGANTLYSMGYVKLASKNRKWSFSQGARRSFPYSWNSPKLKAISDMVFAATALSDTIGQSTPQVLFEDYSSNLKYKLNEKNDFSGTVMFTRSRISYENLDTETNQLTNLGANMKWNHKISDHWKSMSSLTLSDYEFKFFTDLTDSLGIPLSQNFINDINFTEELFHEFSNHDALQFGINYALQRIQFDYKNLALLDSDLIERHSDVQSATLSPFINYEWRSHPKCYLQLGARANHYSLTNDFNLAPRIFFNYYPSKNLTMKMSSGLYYQYMSQVKVLEFIIGGFDNELWQLADGKAFKVMNGTQSMLGAVYHKNDLVIDVEGYYKTTENVTYYSSSKFMNGGYYFSGNQNMYGLDIFVKKNLTERATAWAGYSRSQSKIHVDSAIIANVNSQYSQPNMFYVGGTWQKGAFKTSAGWRYASSQYSRTFRIIQANSQFVKLTSQGRPNAPSVENPFADLPERYPYVHQLDISASYKIESNEKHRWAGTFGVSLINVYNQTNQLDTVVRAGGSSANVTLLPRYGMSFAPNIMVTIEW